MRLHSLEYGEKRAQPCPYCVKGGLEYQDEDSTDGDTYRCMACYCWTSHTELNDGTCGLVFTLGKRRSENAVRCAVVQELLPLESS